MDCCGTSESSSQRLLRVTIGVNHTQKLVKQCTVCGVSVCTPDAERNRNGVKGTSEDYDGDGAGGGSGQIRSKRSMPMVYFTYYSRRYSNVVNKVCKVTEGY